MIIISRYIAIAASNTGREILIDPEYYDLISEYRWREGGAGYASTDRNQVTLHMHRLIMESEPGKQVDHINHNKLDNRRCNLRHCTPSQNHMNRQPKKGKSSKYKGVCYSKSRGLWQANVTKDGKRYNLRAHTTEVEAALAYNKKAFELFGEFVRLNVIGEWDDTPAEEEG